MGTDNLYKGCYVTVVHGSGDNASIGRICNLIAAFEVNEKDMNEGIMQFLKSDKYFRTEEY